MSEYDLFELIFIAGSTAQTAFGLHITFTFAYLTAVHFLGAAFSRVQVIIVSVVYILAAFISFSTMMANLSAMASFQYEVEASPIYQRISFFMDAEIYLVGAPILCALTTLMCFSYLWIVRHPKPE